jgi:two-component system response regulator DevR
MAQPQKSTAVDDNLKLASTIVGLGEASDMNFLVVDDEELVQRAMKRVLGPLGRVTIASTVSDSVKLLRSQRDWTAFFIDLGLPDGSGLDVLAHARIEYPNTPAMVLTGCLDRHAVNTAFDLDAEYVLKPIERSRIERFLFARPDFATRLRATVDAWRQRHGLSEAEADVLLRAAMGGCRESIAEERGGSPHTVRTHVTNLLQKTGDRCLHNAVARVLREIAGDAPAG